MTPGSQTPNVQHPRDVVLPSLKPIEEAIQAARGLGAKSSPEAVKRTRARLLDLLGDMRSDVGRCRVAICGYGEANAALEDEMAKLRADNKALRSAKGKVE